MLTLNVRAVVLGLALVLAVAAVAYGSLAYAEGRPPFGPREDQWHAVFLTNGQAYFGHLYMAPGDYVILTDVHYVLATQLQEQGQQATQLSLQRLGGEIHAPKDRRLIAKEQILFIDELRSDSPLLRAIGELRNAPPPTARPTAAPATAGPAGPSPAGSPARSPSPSPR